MRKLLSLNIIILIFHIALAQEQAKFKDIKTANISAKQIAKQQIIDLHANALLVRLKTGENIINAMIKAGNMELVQKKQKQIDLENKRIIKAFKSEFDFCKVYFFYSKDSKFIKENELSVVNFLDDSLHIIQNIDLNLDKFFIAEFGNVQGDTAQYYSHSVNKSTNNFSQEPQAMFYGGGSTEAKGLIIKDQNFYQLKKPFPFFVKYPFFRKEKNQEIYTIRKLNKNLWTYYRNN